MKIRKMLCIAAAFCMLWTAAAADVNGYAYNAPVNIMDNSARPYSWDVQQYKDDPIAWHVENVLDGKRSTKMEIVGWASAAMDEIPDITFYFNDATISDIWIRNGWPDENYRDYARMGVLGVTVWTGETSEYVYPRRNIDTHYNLYDNYDADVLTTDLYDGYQRFALPRVFQHVTKIEFWIRGWREGEIKDVEHRYHMMVSDIAFLPDSLMNIYGPWIFDPNSGRGYQYQTPTPQPVITAAPQPVVTQAPLVTAAPFSGLDVITQQRLATRSGPGTQYTETGSYYQAGTWVKAISSSYDNANGIWWIQVELTYLGERRRVYTGVKRLVMEAGQVPVESAGEDMILAYSVYGYWGPGYSYSMYQDKIPAGTEGTVRQRENNYAQFEFYDPASGLYRRVWVPESALESSNG